MTEVIVNYLKTYIDNEYLLLFVLSVIPFTEMRGALVLSGGMEVNHILAFLACTGGSAAVVIPLLWLFRPLMRWLKVTKLFKPLANMVENLVGARARELRLHNKKQGNGIYWALFAFVAVPLPLTGVWIGSAIAAFVGLKFWKSAFAIITGNFVAALVLTVLVWLAKDYVDVILIVFVCVLGVSALLLTARRWQKQREKRVLLEKAEAEVPPEEKPVIGEFAAGAEPQAIVIEILDEEKIKELSGKNKNN